MSSAGCSGELGAVAIQTCERKLGGAFEDKGSTVVVEEMQGTLLKVLTTWVFAMILRGTRSGVKRPLLVVPGTSLCGPDGSFLLLRPGFIRFLRVHKRPEPLDTAATYSNFRG